MGFFPVAVVLLGDFCVPFFAGFISAFLLPAHVIEFFIWLAVFRKRKPLFLHHQF